MASAAKLAGRSQTRSARPSVRRSCRTGSRVVATTVTGRLSAPEIRFENSWYRTAISVAEPCASAPSFTTSVRFSAPEQVAVENSDKSNEPANRWDCMGRTLGRVSLAAGRRPMLTSPVSDSDELDQETAGRDRSDADQA